MLSFMRKLTGKQLPLDFTKWPMKGRAAGTMLEGPTIQHTNLPAIKSHVTSHDLARVLSELNMTCALQGPHVGPVTTTYKLMPQGATRIGLLPSRAVDIAVRLGVPSVNITGDQIEIPNRERALVDFTACTPRLFQVHDQHTLPYIVGMDSTGQVRIKDLAEAPHTLIAGSTGAGKSVFVNNILASILATRNPTCVRLVMIDPKRVEYAQYKTLPHLLHPVIDEVPVAVNILKGLCEVMEARYKFLSSVGFQSAAQWNKASTSFKDRIYPVVCFIDEYADLYTQNKKVEEPLMRLAQKARAAGIHLVLCTQHPKADIIKTKITTNFPTQIAFHVRNRSASGVILDRGGAENLLRQGDMIYQDAEESFRCQGPYVSQAMTTTLVEHWSR